MEHILSECSASGQLTVWGLAKALWQLKHDDWPTVTLGTILDCGMSHFTDKEGSPHKGASLLFNIIITESAHLIWKLQCEKRHISFEDDPEKHHSEVEVHHQWVKPSITD
jgi:hypothetical protein